MFRLRRMSTLTQYSIFIPLFVFCRLVSSSYDAQYNTNINKHETPVFKKGAAFVFKYQAVTSESESKVRVFSPFPEIPAINLTDAHTILQTRGHSNTLTGMDTVKLCKTARMGDAFALLFNELEAKLTLLEQEIQDAHKDKTELLRVAKSFLPQEPQNVDHRGKRALGLIAAAAGAAGLVFGDPVKEAACSALSIFSLCPHNKALEADVRNMMRNQQSLQDTLTRVQTKNDRNFFLLGNEIKSTQESVAKIKKSWVLT